jgi:triosephosphate isomerase
VVSAEQANSTTRPRCLIAGNWKMNGLGSAVEEAREVAAALGRNSVRARVAICAPATLLERLTRAVEGSELIIGAEDIHPKPSGAFTGDISAEMVSDAGARMVIVGHSERRTAYGETNELVARKALAAIRGGLEPIICVGESLAERRSGAALDVVRRQVMDSAPMGLARRPFVVAYEPTWAIGSGRQPQSEQIQDVHQVLREVIVGKFGDFGWSIPVLYGGSVDPANAADVLSVAGVNGALVGGASLNADDLLKIVRLADEKSS